MASRHQEIKFSSRKTRRQISLAEVELRYWYISFLESILQSTFK